jgi:small subunit ribosomal protein S1
LVIHVDAGRQKIALSTKKLEYEPGDMLQDPQRVYEEAEATAAAYRERLEVQ